MGPDLFMNRIITFMAYGAYYDFVRDLDLVWKLFLFKSRNWHGI